MGFGIEACEICLFSETTVALHTAAIMLIIFYNISLHKYLAKFLEWSRYSEN